MLGSYTETPMLRCVWSPGQLKSSGVVQLHAAVQTNTVGSCTFYQLNMEIVECLRILNMEIAECLRIRYANLFWRVFKFFRCLCFPFPAPHARSWSQILTVPWPSRKLPARTGPQQVSTSIGLQFHRPGIETVLTGNRLLDGLTRACYLQKMFSHDHGRSLLFVYCPIDAYSLNYLSAVCWVGDNPRVELCSTTRVIASYLPFWEVNHIHIYIYNIHISINFEIWDLCLKWRIPVFVHVPLVPSVPSGQNSGGINEALASIGLMRSEGQIDFYRQSAVLNSTPKHSNL